MINTPIKQRQADDRQIHPGLQFLIFAGIFLAVMIICNVIGIGIVIAIYGSKGLTAITSLDTAAPGIINMLWIIQIIGTTLPILAVPVIFAYSFTSEPKAYLKTTFSFQWGLLFLVLLVMFFSNPAIELLSNINQKMQLPQSFKGLEDWMKASEKSAQKVTEAMLQMNSIWGMLYDVLLIGLVTAIVEEFMFRGVLQTIFMRWTKNVHAAVWITAILFSAFHMEFYGFLPRVLLGVLFGYFVAWSGSIWPAVWGHFLNNGADVVITYLSQKKIIEMDVNNQHVFTYVGYTISALAMLILLLIYRQVTLAKKQIAQYDGEGLD